MKRQIFTILTALVMMFSPGLAGTALAAPKCGTGSSAKEQILQGFGEAGSKCSDRTIIDVISAAINILSFVVGIVAIIAIILAGFKYITSAGESNKVSNAKQTLIYALVGIVVAALAQVLVHFVLFNIHKAAD